MAHAHQKGVLHCDVKPGNVLLLQDLSASLLDFNLASSTDDAVGLAGGTLPYMAPEQLQRLLPPKSENSSTEHPDATNGHSGSPERSNISEESPASTATDVFGLAATMWHMVSGEPPFGVGVDLENREESAAELLNRQREGVSKAGLQKAHQILSAPAVEVLLKGLEWNPKDRHSSAAALADELKALVPATRQRRSLLRTAAFPIALAAVVVPTILAVLPLPLWLTPLSFPSTPTASLPTETRSSDQFQPIPYVDQARELIGNRRFDDAQIALEPVLETDPTAQFFDLYCRTCKLKHLPRQALNSTPVEDAPKGSNWETIAVEWLGFASVGEFTSEANVNLAYLLLEFGDSPEFERSRKHLEAAISAGVTEPKVVQTLALLNLKAEDDSLSALKMPDGLRQSVLQTGTRGEILAYLCILRKALEADPEEFHPELNALVDEAINRCFSANEPMVEPQAAKLLFHGSLHQKVGLNKKVTDVLHRSRTDSRNPMNRLADVLMLPRKVAVKIASNDR